jgi:zinc transporter 1/2/3
MASEEQPQCGSGRSNVDLIGLRVASLFIIGACTMLGTFFPILAKRSKFFKVPPLAYE